MGYGTYYTLSNRVQFIAIADHNGFTKAADYLGYAQSTITSHIQILESQLGGPIFDRLGKRIVVTNLGKSLLPYARKMISIYNDILTLSAIDGEVKGAIVIGLSETLTIYFIGDFIKKYKELYPQVNISLMTGNCTDLRSKLYTGEVDITITISPKILDNDLVVKTLRDESMYIIGSTTSEINLMREGKGGININESIIYGESGCLARLAFEKYLKDKDILYKNPIQLSSTEAIKHCVVNGLGIAYMPYYAIEKEVKEGKLQIVEIPDLKNIFKTQLCYHKGKNLTNPTYKFIEIINI